MSDTPRVDRFTTALYHAACAAQADVPGVYGHDTSPEEAYGQAVELAKTLERELGTRRWIPVSENCPAEWERVLAINSAGYMTTTNGMYRTSNGQWHGEDLTAEETHCVISDITHWMPLPPPPNRMAEGEDRNG